MGLITPCIIAPDSSHWAGWADAVLSREPARRAAGHAFEQRLISAGRVPVLSFHHLEELLAIDDAAHARDRLSFLSELTLVAWLRVDATTFGPGGIVDIVAAEAIAALSGAGKVDEVRDGARSILLQTGSARAVLGDELWVWEAVREEFRRRNVEARDITAVTPVHYFDDQRTIREIVQGRIRSSAEQVARVHEIRASLITEITNHGDKRISDPSVVADSFLHRVNQLSVPDGVSVRDLIVASLTAQGLDRHEVRDDALLADLNVLALLRNRLKTVAPLTGRSFEDLKPIPEVAFPHHLIYRSLKLYGQRRKRRPGGDLNDGHLAALAPFVDELYVDRRTAEDFRRASRRDPDLRRLIGRVGKASTFQGLTASPC